MDDDVLDGQQPGKREERRGREGLAVSHAKRREEGGRERGRDAASSSSLSRKLPRALKYDVVGGDFSRVPHVRGRPARRPHSSQRAGQTTVVGRRAGEEVYDRPPHRL